MTIKVGDALPEATFAVMTEDGPSARASSTIFDGRKVVLVAVPGAFTPTCSMNHLPGFIDNAEAIKAKGVDEILVTAVNDVFVMGAWEKATGAAGKVTFLADGSARFAQALGLTLDLTERGLGTRSKRYAMIVDDGVVKSLAIEANPGEADTSTAENVLKAL
jgi:glutaredoxin/glutathione-dependent peroxiredoxin